MDTFYKKPLPYAIFGLVLLLGGCASVDSGQNTVSAETDPKLEEGIVADVTDTEANVDVEMAEELPAPEEDIVYGNFSEDVLSQIILAELAGQRGLNQDALNSYQALARETRDINIIKRATRISAFSRDAINAIEMAELWLEQEPDSLEALQTVAVQNVTLARYGRALDHLTHMLDLGAEVDFRLLTSRIVTDNNINLIIDALIADVADLSQLYPDNQSLHLALANLYQQNEQTLEAYEVVKQLSIETNDAPEIVIYEMQLLEQLGESEHAYQRLQESLLSNPEHRQLRFLYGRKLVDERRYNEAMEQFSIIVEQNPLDFDMLYSLALISMEVNQTSNAKSYFQRLLDNSQRQDDAHYYLAAISAQENDIDQAIEHYLQVNAGSNFLAAQRNVTELMVQQGHYPQASARLQNIRFRNPDYNIPLLTMEANVLLEQEEYDEAKVFLNSAVGAFPNNMALLFLRSVLSTELNNLPLMEQDLRKIIRLNPNNPTAYNSLGYTLADRTDRYEEAYQLIQQAITLAPNDPAIIDSLGWIQYHLGLYQEARESLGRAFELFPDHEVAAHLGEVLWVLGEKREANKVWRRALEIQPDSKFILETMERLNSDLSE